jgi:hypothetical protein
VLLIAEMPMSVLVEMSACTWRHDNGVSVEVSAPGVLVPAKACASEEDRAPSVSALTCLTANEWVAADV